MTSWMSVLYVVEGFFLRFWKSVGVFFFFWPFLALLNRNSEEWQESGGREREEDMRQVISDSNIGRPLLAIHHVVACSPQWAKPAPHVWCFSDADKYEPFIDVLGVHLFPVPLCNKKKVFLLHFCYQRVVSHTSGSQLNPDPVPCGFKDVMSFLTVKGSFIPFFPPKVFFIDYFNSLLTVPIDYSTYFVRVCNYICPPVIYYF